MKTFVTVLSFLIASSAFAAKNDLIRYKAPAMRPKCPDTAYSCCIRSATDQNGVSRCADWGCCDNISDVNVPPL